MKRWLAAATLCLIVALSIVGLGTTATGAATFTYDVPTTARFDVHEFGSAAATSILLRNAREESVSSSVQARGTSTTPSATFVATEAVPSAAKAADLVRGANPVGSALKSDAAHRAASFVVDDIASNGSVFRTVDGDGVTRTLVQAPGELNGLAGRFEWIVDDAGSLTHQMFVKGGSINGVPIKP